MIELSNQARPVDVPRISVAIPACGRPAYLDECLRSVVNQTLPASEIVVSEDGEDPENAALIGRYTVTGAPIRHVTNVPALGQLANRQQAFRLTTGDFVAMVDDDDAWSDDFLEATHAAIAASGCGFCSTDHDIMDGDSQVLGDESNAAARRFGRVTMSQGRYDDVLMRELEARSFALQFTLFTRPVLEAVGFFPSSGSTVPDFALFLELGAAGVSGYYLPRRLGRYRVHPAQQREDRVAKGHALTGCIRGFSARHPELHPHARRAAAELYRRSVIELAIAYAHQGRRARAVRMLRSYGRLGWDWPPPARAGVLAALLAGARKHSPHLESVSGMVRHAQLDQA